MRFMIALAALSFATCGAFAAEKKAPSPAQLAQQEKMKTCNMEATGKKGQERKAFMSKCLSKSG